MTYALGRRVEASDMPAVRAIVREAARKNYRMSAFILGIVNSRRSAWRRPTRPPRRMPTTVDKAVR